MTTNEKLLNLSAGARAAVNVIHDLLRPSELAQVKEESEKAIEALFKFDLKLREVLHARGVNNDA